MTKDPFHGETAAQRRRRLGKMEPGVRRAVAFTSALLLVLAYSPMLFFIGLCFAAGALSK